MITRFRYWLVILLLAPALSFAAARAVLDRDHISIYESVNLELSSDKAGDQPPDFGPLSADFDISSTGKTVAVEMINGQVKREIRWVVSLTPKHAGTLTIPALNFGAQKTNPLKLTVLDKQPVENNADEFFIETTVDPKEAYLQQQVLYTLRVWVSRPLANASFTPPSVSEGASLTPIDKQTNVTRTRAGRQYEVIEKRYVVSSEKAGTITINSPRLQALTLNRYQRNSFFGGADSVPIHLVGKSIKLTVKPKPSTWQGSWWLPAARLTLKDNWGQGLKNWRVGEPLTRSITVQGWGVSAEQLPEIKMDALAGINSYQDKTETKNQIEQNMVVGTRQIKMALVPTQAGEWQLPAIKVQWWNVNTNKMEVAEIPTITATILPALGAAPSAGAVPGVPATSGSATATGPAALGAQQQSGTVNAHQDTLTLGSSKNIMSDQRFWTWLVVLFALLWLLSSVIIILLWRKLRSLKIQTNIQHGSTKKSDPSLLKVINTIKDCCAKKDARATIAATVTWARMNWPSQNINSLQEAADHLKYPQFKEEVSRLLAACYRHENSPWNAEQYWQVFQEAISCSSSLNDKRPAKDYLPPLYG
jgi:hypothetical protein